MFNRLVNKSVLDPNAFHIIVNPFIYLGCFVVQVNCLTCYFWMCIIKKKTRWIEALSLGTIFFESYWLFFSDSVEPKWNGSNWYRADNSYLIKFYAIYNWLRDHSWMSELAELEFPLTMSKLCRYFFQHFFFKIFLFSSLLVSINSILIEILEIPLFNGNIFRIPNQTKIPPVVQSGPVCVIKSSNKVHFNWNVYS